MILVAQALVFLAALAGIAAGSLAMIYFAGRAMNRSRSRALRSRDGLLAAASLVGIAASAGAGFVGVALLLYVSAQ